MNKHHQTIDSDFAKRWRKRMNELRAQSGEPGSRRESLDREWTAALAVRQGYNPHRRNDREGPLLAVVTAVQSGDYPTPEALLALEEAMDEYMRGNGEIDLEIALLGPVKRRAGNFSRRTFFWRNKFAQAHDPSKGPSDTLESRQRQAREFLKLEVEDVEPD